MRESIKPMKKVKPSSRTTPIPLFLVRSMPHMKAKATPMKSRKDISGLPPKNEKPICTPISAPMVVGSMDSASNR